MLKTISIAGLAFAMTIGTFAAPLSMAQAQDVQLRLGPDGVRIQDRNRDRDLGRQPRGGCSPEEATDAARDEGFRRARVVRVTDRSVTVEGMTRGGPDRIVFANRRGCPEL